MNFLDRFNFKSKTVEQCSRCGRMKPCKPLKFEGTGAAFKLMLCGECMLYYKGGGK